MCEEIYEKISQCQKDTKIVKFDISDNAEVCE